MGKPDDPDAVYAHGSAAAVRGVLLGKGEIMQDFMHLIKIHVSAERVYEAITTADGIRQWWTRDAAIEPRVGASGAFGFHGKRFVAKITVEKLNPVTHVRRKVTNSAWHSKIPPPRGGVFVCLCPGPNVAA